VVWLHAFISFVHSTRAFEPTLYAQLVLFNNFSRNLSLIYTLYSQLALFHKFSRHLSLICVLFMCCLIFASHSRFCFKAPNSSSIFLHSQKLQNGYENNILRPCDST